MMKNFLDRFFKIEAHNSTVRTEILAGITTFLTMSYIILVNPVVMSDAGINLGAAFVATCLAAAVGCFLTGILANYPVAVAPSMALNAYFTYDIVQKLGYSWETALGAVFISGVMIIILTVTKFRRWLIESIPQSLNIAIASGIGLFIALVALKMGGIIKPDVYTLLALGQLNTFSISSMKILLFFLGFLIIIILSHHRVPGSIIIGIITISLLGMFLGINHFHGFVSLPPSIHSTLFVLNFKMLFHREGLIIIFTFFLITLFDSTGTLIGLIEQTKITRDANKAARLSNALMSDAIATTAGALLGTSTTSPYLESAAGIKVGGKTGLTAIIVGFCFLIMLFFSPLGESIPTYATGPALLYVSCLMLRHIAYVNWDDLTESIPSIITFMMIPFTFSIADGVGLGFISYVFIKLLTGKIKDLNVMLIILTIAFGFYFMLRP